MAKLSRLLATTAATLALLLVAIGVPAFVAWQFFRTSSAAQFQTTTTIALSALAIVGIVLWMSLAAAMVMQGRRLRHVAFLPSFWQRFFRRWVEASSLGLGTMRSWTAWNPDVDLSFLIQPATAMPAVSVSSAAVHPPVSMAAESAIPTRAPIPEPRAVVPVAVTSYQVQRGDNFRSLAGAHLGDQERWSEILKANLGREVAPDVFIEDGTRFLKSGWVIGIPIGGDDV